MTTEIFIIRFCIVAVGITIFDGLLVIFYLYLEDWMFHLIDFQKKTDETSEKCWGVKVKRRILVTLSKIGIKIIRLCEIIFRRLDVWDFFRIVDEYTDIQDDEEV